MITIVVSSYKYGHLASHCIETILSQTKKPERILFVDDGAGDCKDLPDLYPEVEFILRENNLGIVVNFDDMLHRVQSEFVMFVGADNWIRSDTIELLEQAVSSNECDVVIYDILVTGELKDEILFRHPNEVRKLCGDYYWNRHGHHGSMLYRTKLGQEVGYKKRQANSLYTEEGWHLWNELEKKNARVVHLPESLLYYRRHKENFNKY